MLKLVLLFAALALATPDCTQQCKQWASVEGDVSLEFTPCTLGIDNLRVAYDDGTVVESFVSIASTYQCGKSGSGTQLTVSVPTVRGTAQLSWSYAERDSDLLCSTLLRGGNTDSKLVLLGFAVTVPGSPLLSWGSGAKIALSTCPVAHQRSSRQVYAALLSQPNCYTNQGSRYTLTGTTNSAVSVLLLWSFQTLLDGTVDSATIRLDSTDIPSATPAFQCTYNLGTALVQFYDGDTHNWAVSWTYRSYASCDAVLQAIAAGTDVIPDVESAVVVVPGDQTYSWQRDPGTVAFSTNQVDCPSPSPSVTATVTMTTSRSPTATRTPSSTPSSSPSSSANPSGSAVPTPSVTPSVTPSTSSIPSASASTSAAPSASPSASAAPQPLPVQPFVNCLTVPTLGMCVASFGYYNPNPWPVTLVAGSADNQLQRSAGVYSDPIPSVFEPGMHNNTFYITYPCNRQGMPSVSWKLRSPVPSSVAGQLEDMSCSRGCSNDLIYRVDHCSALFDPWQRVPSGPDVPVMRCARTDPGAAPRCFLA